MPTESIESPSENRQVEHASPTSIQPKPSGQYKKKAPRTGKKVIMMVGVPIVLATVIVGGIVAAKMAKPKPDVQAPAGAAKKEKVINSASVGSRLDDFVKKFGGGDSIAVVAFERMNYKYTGFGIAENTVLVVGCDDDRFVTCGVLFKLDGNKPSKALPLDASEIERGLKIFSRHEGVDWYESTSDGEDPRNWGYLWPEKAFKWGSSALMGEYSSQYPYLLVVSTNSESESFKNLRKDMQHWQVVTRYEPKSK